MPEPRRMHDMTRTRSAWHGTRGTEEPDATQGTDARSGSGIWPDPKRLRQGAVRTTPRMIRTAPSRPGRERTQRSERLTAEMMAFSELVEIEESMPTPQMIRASGASPIWHST